MALIAYVFFLLVVMPCLLLSCGYLVEKYTKRPLARAGLAADDKRNAKTGVRIKPAPPASATQGP